LQDAGFKRIDTASNGAEAWAKIRSDNPDLVILDHSMPDMTGLDVIAKVREQESTRELPVLLVSAHEDRAFRADALRAGATNVMTKPVDPDLLIHRTRQLLETLLAVRQLRAYQRRVTVELRQAQRMQEELMPSNEAMAAVADANGVQLSARFQMSSELGGDWWGLSDFGGGLFGLYMVDFSGHGVGPAINTFRLHTLMRDNPPPLDGPGGYLTRLNSRICSILPRGQYATMLYGVFDVAERRFTYAATGCPPIIFGTADGTLVATGETAGVPLGLSRKSAFEDRVIDIPEAGFMLLYSDALLECPSLDGEMLGDEGLMKLVRSVLEEPSAEAPLDRLVNRFMDRTRSPLDDDLTAVWLGL
jgi:sigma-B regulation protein RsbU (phosphoserine phosphatase)